MTPTEAQEIMELVVTRTFIASGNPDPPAMAIRQAAEAASARFAELAEAGPMPLVSVDRRAGRLVIDLAAGSDV